MMRTVTGDCPWGERDQITTIGENPLGMGEAVGGEPGQQVAALLYGGNPLGGREIAVAENQHIRRNGAHQSGSHALFGNLTGSKNGIYDGVGSHFGQVQTAHLRKGAARLA